MKIFNLVYTIKKENCEKRSGGSSVNDVFFNKIKFLKLLPSYKFVNPLQRSYLKENENKINYKKNENERTYDEECSNVWGYNFNIVIWNAHSPAREHLLSYNILTFSNEPPKSRDGLPFCLRRRGHIFILKPVWFSVCIKMMISIKLKCTFVYRIYIKSSQTFCIVCVSTGIKKTIGPKGP